MFSDWLITGASGKTHRVEIRSLKTAINSCGCKDYQISGLGTCKHIEAVLKQAHSRKYRHQLDSCHPDIEIFLDRRDEHIRVSFPGRALLADEMGLGKTVQAIAASELLVRLHGISKVLVIAPASLKSEWQEQITQFLDPSLFGPLFRFNREFHELDEKGQAVGYKNLDRLHQRLRPVMLRRRKEDVEGELPERSINNYFLAMTTEQLDQYAEHEAIVARLAHLAKKRPLLKKERDRLMQALGCMRMACDTPFILDQKTRVSPKLDELEKLLDELLGDPACKIIVFSEWERMLSLLAQRLRQAGIDYAWHTGSVTRKNRRKEINRFKHDPDCCLFIATDSAATGLNLQVARVVINLDLPWNPARQELHGTPGGTDRRARATASTTGRLYRAGSL